jgi:hypothetical protein
MPRDPASPTPLTLVPAPLRDPDRGRQDDPDHADSPPDAVERATNYRTHRTEIARAKFLAQLAQSGNVTESCQISGLPRATAYDWRREDQGFAQQWDAAMDRGADAMEDECRRRAMAGSDALMVFMMRALKPEKYREKAALDVTMRTAADYRNMSVVEIRARLAELRAEQDDLPEEDHPLLIEADAIDLGDENPQPD